jgi:two-component system, sensor histidine kinase YesM
LARIQLSPLPPNPCYNWQSFQAAGALLKPMYTGKKLNSFKYQLITAFLFISLLPFLIIQFYSAYTLLGTMKSHSNELMKINLQQIQRTFDMIIGFYDDTLYQIYTDDAIVTHLNDIYKNNNPALMVNYIRRRLNSLVSSRSEIQGATIISADAQIIAYDKLSAMTMQNAWLGTSSEEIAFLYSRVRAYSKPALLPRYDEVWFAERPYHLFHLSYRILDYRRLEADIGIVILTLDETVLAEICNESLSGKVPSILNFMIDAEGTIVSFPDKDHIGRPLPEGGSLEDSCRTLLVQSGLLPEGEIAVETLKEAKSGWTMVSAAGVTSLYARIDAQRRINILLAVLSTVGLMVIILYLTNRLTSGLLKFSKSMIKVGEGDFSVQITPDRRMPGELKTIAHGFNTMTKKLKQVLNEVREISEKHKTAEINYLETQINPHFLYNTLDSINWMAIEQEEYEISEMLSNLAQILRYGVDKSSCMVTISEDVYWLKKYIRLQGIRYKYSFQWEIDLDAKAENILIHKMIIQPFVENALVHGFAEMSSGGLLKTSIASEEGRIFITVSDNGVGLPWKVADKINNSEPISGIGMSNAIQRLHMYYGDDVEIRVDTNSMGTTVRMSLPVLESKKKA